MKTRDLAEMALYEAMRPRNPTVLEPRVEIHQQPNDAADAARLFGELKAKAQEEIVQSIKVGDNIFECVVHHWRDEMSCTTHWRAVFKLNGKQMTATVEGLLYRSDQTWMDQVRANFAKLQEEMAKVIAGEVLSRAFMEAARKMGGRV